MDQPVDEIANDEFEQPHPGYSFTDDDILEAVWTWISFYTEEHEDVAEDNFRAFKSSFATYLHEKFFSDLSTIEDIRRRLDDASQIPSVSPISVVEHLLDERFVLQHGLKRVPDVGPENWTDYEFILELESPTGNVSVLHEQHTRVDSDAESHEKMNALLDKMSERGTPLFHGTTRYSASSILLNGFEVRRSRRDSDFGPLPARQLSESGRAGD